MCLPQNTTPPGASNADAQVVGGADAEDAAGKADSAEEKTVRGSRPLHNFQVRAASAAGGLPLPADSAAAALARAPPPKSDSSLPLHSLSDRRGGDLDVPGRGDADDSHATTGDPASAARRPGGPAPHNGSGALTEVAATLGSPSRFKPPPDPAGQGLGIGRTQDSASLGSPGEAGDIAGRQHLPSRYLQLAARAPSAGTPRLVGEHAQRAPSALQLSSGPDSFRIFSGPKASHL